MCCSSPERERCFLTQLSVVNWQLWVIEPQLSGSPSPLVKLPPPGQHVTLSDCPGGGIAVVLSAGASLLISVLVESTASCVCVCGL